MYCDGGKATNCLRDGEVSRIVLIILITLQDSSGNATVSKMIQDYQVIVLQVGKKSP